MPISLNLEGVKEELEALPPGNYLGTIASAQEAESKASGNPMLAVKYRVDEPEEHEGRMLFDNFSLQPQALWKIKGWLRQLGYDDDELESQIELDPEELVGLTVGMAVINEPYQGRDRSRVAGYFSGLDAALEDVSLPDDDDVEFGF